MLKNGKDPSKPFLPLTKNAKKILVAGTHANDLGYQCGGWTKTWDGMSGQITVGKPLFFFLAFPKFFVDFLLCMAHFLWADKCWSGAYGPPVVGLRSELRV